MLFLNVDYNDKDEVKKIGARWNPELKKWYVFSRKDYNKFGYWIGEKESAISYVIFDYFYLVKSVRQCFKCKKYIPVVAFAFDSYCVLYDEEYESAWNYWENNGDEDMPEPILQANPYKSFYGKVREDLCIVSEMQPVTQFMSNELKDKFNYYYGFSKTTQSKEYSNHCINCGMLQGNFYLFDELFGSPFNIGDTDIMKNVEFVKYKLPCDIVVKIGQGFHFSKNVTGFIGDLSDVIVDSLNYFDYIKESDILLPFELISHKMYK